MYLDDRLSLQIYVAPMGEQARPARRPRLSIQDTAQSLPTVLGGAGWAIPHTEF